MNPQSSMAALATAIASDENVAQMDAGALLMLKFANPDNKDHRDLGQGNSSSPGRTLVKRGVQQLAAQHRVYETEGSAPSQRRYLSAKSKSGFLGVKR